MLRLVQKKATYSVLNLADEKVHSSVVGSVLKMEIGLVQHWEYYLVFRLVQKKATHSVLNLADEKVHRSVLGSVLKMEIELVPRWGYY